MSPKRNIRHDPEPSSSWNRSSSGNPSSARYAGGLAILRSSSIIMGLWGILRLSVLAIALETLSSCRVPLLRCARH